LEEPLEHEETRWLASLRKQAKATKSKQKQTKASKSKQKQAKASKSKQKQAKSKQKQAKASKLRIVMLPLRFVLQILQRPFEFHAS
jgi:hypothetical protein